jgi:hypothetical protein
MAISIRGNASAWIFTASAASLTPTLPTHAAGDMLIVRAICKAATGQAPSGISITCATSGWAAVAAQFNTSATVNANGDGGSAMRAFWKIATSSSETNPQVDFGAPTPSPAQVCSVVYQHGASEEFITPVSDGGGDSTARTSQTWTIASHISTTAGDMVDFFIACGDNIALTNPTFTQAGLTLGTVAEQPATAGITALGNDGASDGGYRLVSSGTSSAAAVVTSTFASSEQGGAVTIRLRVQATAAPTDVTIDTTERLYRNLIRQ